MQFHDLAGFHTNSGVVGSEVIIFHLTDQETAGIEDHIAPVGINLIDSLEIDRHTDGCLADFIPVLRIVETGFIVDAALVGDQIKAALFQTAVDVKNTALAR